MNEFCNASIIRRHPVNHLLGQLVAVETEDGRLDDEELLSLSVVDAGNETTTGLITASRESFMKAANSGLPKAQSSAALCREALGEEFAVFGYRQAYH